MSAASTKSADWKQGSTSTPIKDQLAQECKEVREDFQILFDDVGTSINTYCKKRPQIAGLMIFAIGFYVGWKVKPW